MHKPNSAVQASPLLPPPPTRTKKVRPSLHLPAEVDGLIRRVAETEGWSNSDLAAYWIRLGETASRAGYYLTPAGEMKRRALAEIQAYPKAERRGTP